MSKKSKKRNKPYAGADAATTTPHIRRYSVPQRSTSGEWWHEHKRQAIVRGVLFALALLVGWGIYSLIR